ncbi:PENTATRICOPEPTIDE REPEAT-CONTAINING PROTEIN [Salix koriyanagi]|uniref:PENTATRICOPEPTIDE REPEAT-CONTAINING PROTEIN n=1 Tax=Salix koriyanagi TaxID=2511006 RepID=A0A9Q0T5D6_9ROSI|nr:PENTATRICOPEPTIDE REPEAT-CONTAINING PROTEIN [Salix koriyanagi]
MDSALSSPSLNADSQSKTSKISTLHFATTSLGEKLDAHLQNSPNNVEKTLNSLAPIKLDTKYVNDIIHRWSLNNLQLGLRFFIWAGDQPNYKHNLYIYNKACSLFKIKQNPQVILDLIATYKVEKYVVCVDTFKVVLRLCKVGGLADEALMVLKKMPEFNIRPDTTAYNLVIRSLCEKGDMDMAKQLMGEMGLIDLYPDMITYVSMIKGFGIVEKAFELLAEMEKEGEGCRPNVITYTSVIQSFCEQGRAKDALSVLELMEVRGCAPNRVTASAWINGVCMNGQLQDVYKFIERIVGGGSVSMGDCYSSLVVCLIKIKKVEEAEKTFRMALSSGMKPDSLACSMMIREICSEKRVLDGFCLYEEVEKTGCLSSIDIDIYSILLAGLCQKSHSAEAARLARSMVEKRIPLRTPYVEKIVEHLKNFGGKELVAELVSMVR